MAEIPSRPEGPAVACQVRLNASEALVQVASSDAAGSKLGPVRQVHAAGQRKEQGKFDVARFADGLAEGILSRLVRAQVIKGTARDKGKLVYQMRIDNASPLDP